MHRHYINRANTETLPVRLDEIFFNYVLTQFLILSVKLSIRSIKGLNGLCGHPIAVCYQKLFPIILTLMSFCNLWSNGLKPNSFFGFGSVRCKVGSLAVETKVAPPQLHAQPTD